MFRLESIIILTSLKNKSSFSYGQRYGECTAMHHSHLARQLCIAIRHCFVSLNHVVYHSFFREHAIMRVDLSLIRMIVASINN